MASRLQDVHRLGLAAARPLATAVAKGTLYFSTDTFVLERSDGTVWAPYSGASAPAGLTMVSGVPSGNTTGAVDTFVDVAGLSISLTAGTWIIWARANFICPFTTYIIASITTAANVAVASGRNTFFTGDDSTQIPVNVVVTPAVSTSYKLRFATNSASSVCRHLDPSTSTVVTEMIALKVA